MDTRSGTMNINGANLFYKEAGEGLPVVLVHAGIADHRMWDDQFPVIARRFRAITFDMRGYGQSQMPAGPYALHDDLYQLLRALNADRAALIGCSLGGQTVIDFAIAHPAMTTALIPVCTGLSGEKDDDSAELPPLIQEIIAADQAGDLDRVNELEIQLWVDGLKREPGSVRPDVREKVLMMNRIALETPAGLGQPQTIEPPAAGRLNEIQAPTLVIYGDLDMPNVIDTCQRIGSEVPNAKVASVSGTAHLPNMERPQAFNTLVMSFLESLAESKGR